MDARIRQTWILDAAYCRGSGHHPSHQKELISCSMAKVLDANRTKITKKKRHQIKKKCDILKTRLTHHQLPQLFWGVGFSQLFGLCKAKHQSLPP